MTKIKREKSEYITTLYDPQSIEDFILTRELTGFVLCGRSNVGKSTFINAFIKNGIARTSNTPGKTQNINVYLFYIEDREQPFYLFDLPGYGHAKVSKEERKRWNHFLDAFMKIIPESLLTVHLMDARNPFQAVDMEFSDYFTQLQRNHIIVFNKFDKLKKQKEKNELKKKTQGLSNAHFFISAEKKQNLAPLEEFLANHLYSLS